MNSRRLSQYLFLLSIFVMALSSLSFAQGPPRGEGPVWGRGPRPNRGACFYRDANFGGDYFCMKAGQSYGFLPPGFNDRISSVRTFHAGVVFYNDHDFTGLRAETRRSLSNLKAWPLPTDPRKTWNDRISSIQVQ
ncbi:MAG TPA: peptidase inhibitor family I36 protein [Terriglobales bacterium]|nr:peptidase inhibitor family I36 protein [Terriglobales bacterium]